MNIFERKEIKYLLSPSQFLFFTNELSQYLIKDKYFEYKICNIYYDTDNYDLFRISIDKPSYKEKLRLRSYGTPTNSSMVFLEIKKKYKGIVYKRRIDILLSEVQSFFSSNSEGNSINEKEIKNLLKRYNLFPKVYLSYNRQAYTWITDNNLRITFDKDIKYRLNNVELEYGDEGDFLFDEPKVLMEIKTKNSLPPELIKIMNENKIYPISFSKIGTVYKNKIVKGSILC